MSGPVMLDANVLVYADDMMAGAKRTRACEVIRALNRSGLAVVTPQVLGEYWVVATLKLKRPVPVDEADLRVRLYLNTMRLIPYGAPVIIEAMRGARRYGFHYYDAQIWAAALRTGVSTVLTEDFAVGSVIEGVRFLNPFADDFDVQSLLDT